MSCESFRDNVVDLARGEGLPEETERAACLSHAASCPACAALLIDQQALSDGFRAWQAADIESPSSSAPPRLEAELLAVFRSHAIYEKERFSLASQSKRRARRLIEMSGIAAMLLATAAVGIYSFLPRAASESARQTPAPSPEVVVKDAGKQTVNDDAGKQQEMQPPAALKPKLIAHKASSRGAGSIRRRQAGKAESARQAKQQPEGREAVESEIATDFINLAEGVAENPMESGQIVRVQVPRSTLASFGLPLNADREGGAIKADLLVGHDGVARAIRFVR